MSNLFAGTQELVDSLKAHGVSVVDIEPHDADDEDATDRIWLERYADGGMCDGEYIFVGESRYGDSDRVDLCGGHPTYWATYIPAGDSKAIQALILEHWPKGK